MRTTLIAFLVILIATIPEAAFLYALHKRKKWAIELAEDLKYRLPLVF